MSAALPRRLFMTSGPAASGAIALTFDDGPDPVHTPAVLERLRALGARATFFVVGQRAAAYPDLVTRMAREGHEVGHHSFSHSDPASTSAGALASESRRTADLLQSLLGRRPALFRPPHGKVTPGKLLALWAQGQTVVLWNRDPKDFAQGSTDPIRRFFESEPLAAGDILLLHDVHPHVAPALDAVVRRARGLGLALETPLRWLDG
jgi:peptidoglycan/xylan/chitin deacetylase (PgdA/CDA1 family)